MRSVAIVPTQTQIKIMTMAIKKNLRNVMFLSTKNHLQSFYGAFFSSFILIATCLRSRLAKIIGKLFDYNDFCTNEGIIRKNFRK